MESRGVLSMEAHLSIEIKYFITGILALVRNGMRRNYLHKEAVYFPNKLFFSCIHKRSNSFCISEVAPFIHSQSTQHHWTSSSFLFKVHFAPPPLTILLDLNRTSQKPARSCSFRTESVVHIFLKTSLARSFCFFSSRSKITFQSKKNNVVFQRCMSQEKQCGILETHVFCNRLQSLINFGRHLLDIPDTWFPFVSIGFMLMSIKRKPVWTDWLECWCNLHPNSCCTKRLTEGLVSLTYS